MVYLNFVQFRYSMQYLKAEIKRRERLESIAQNVEEQMEWEKTKEVFGKTINAISEVGTKAAKGD